jgi:CheY-like chemotaxis protein
VTRILVADDDQVVSRQICGLLKQRGYAATPVFDSTQAFMQATREPYADAIILDITMPGGSGIEMLRKLKALPRTQAIPVIIVSGTTDPTHEATALELGADAFLHKPVDPDALCAAVERAMGPPSSP